MNKLFVCLVVAFSVLSLTGCKEEETVNIKLKAFPVSLAKLAMISDCMFVDRCELPTKISEDKRFLVFEFSPADGVVARISMTTYDAVFIEVLSEEGIALIVDSNMDGLVDGVQWITKDAKVVNYTSGSVGWMLGQTHYVDIVESAKKYAEAYHTERQLEKKIHKKELGLVET